MYRVYTTYLVRRDTTADAATLLQPPSICTNLRPCFCRLLMQAVHAGCSCGLLMRVAHAGCSCRLLMQAAHAGCSCRLPMRAAHSGCSCRLLIKAAHDAAHVGCPCKLLMQAAHAGCSCRTAGSPTVPCGRAKCLWRWQIERECVCKLHNVHEGEITRMHNLLSNWARGGPGDS